MNNYVIYKHGVKVAFEIGYSKEDAINRYCGLREITSKREYTALEISNILNL